MFGKWKPKFSQPASLGEECRSIVEEIKNGIPINPQHSQPASIDQEGFESCISNTDREAFAKTRNSGLVINRHLNWGSWRVQEINKPLLPIFLTIRHSGGLLIYIITPVELAVCIFTLPPDRSGVT